MTGERDTRTQKFVALTWAGFAAGAAAGIIATLSSYVRREIARRGYPNWDECQCEFKNNTTVFQVIHSHHEQRGETVFAEEWGFLLSHPPRWLRRFLHSSAQTLATLNPRGSYVERVSLSPQEARQFALLLQANTVEGESTPEAHIAWRREILYAPHNIFDKCIRRLYPAHLSPERLATSEPLPAIWDPHSNLPLPTEGELLDTPVGTRIDCIGWTPSQISYCTARFKDTK